MIIERVIFLRGMGLNLVNTNHSDENKLITRADFQRKEVIVGDYFMAGIPPRGSACRTALTIL